MSTHTHEHWKVKWVILKWVVLIDEPYVVSIPGQANIPDQ